MARNLTPAPGARRGRRFVSAFDAACRGFPRARDREAAWPGQVRFLLEKRSGDAVTIAAVLSRKQRPAPPVAPIFERFEWHYTPKHGGWLDMAESELAVLSSQRLVEESRH
jgi:hypothetical protein